jgi:hypothetical protein
MPLGAENSWLLRFQPMFAGLGAMFEAGSNFHAPRQFSDSQILKSRRSRNLFGSGFAGLGLAGEVQEADRVYTLSPKLDSRPGVVGG